MSILPIRIMGDPVLREKARPVENFDAALKRLAADMIETMYDSNGVGLAAPQVGVSGRMFVFDDGEGGPTVIVNPELYDFEEEQDGEEGCLSLPGIYFNVKRSLRVKVRAFDVDGTPLQMESEELLARIFQHETDHIDGMLFIDRLSAEDRKEAMRLLREQEFGLIPQKSGPSRAL